MLIGGILLGLIVGIVLGGKLEHLASVRLRFLPLLFIAVIVRFGTEFALGQGVPLAESLRMPLLAFAYLLLLYVLWKNRLYPGMALAFVGIAANGLAIAANGGRMPVWDRAYDASNLQGPLDSVLHYKLTTGLDAEFLSRLGPLGDIIPIPIPFIANVASIGDVFLSAGLGFFLFATLLRGPQRRGEPETDSTTYGTYTGLAGTTRLRPRPQVDEDRIIVRAGTGLTAAFDDAIALERPLMMGAGSMGLASPALAPLPPELVASRAAVAAERGLHAAAALRARAAAIGGAVPAVEAGRRPSFLERIRSHPYVRLALNPSFSALWVGQVISLFGDRVNQIALAAFVYEVTKSPIALALTFFVGTVPNLVLSPIAGAFVDRWDHKQVLVISDLLRAASVMLIPVSIILNVWLAYPIIFVITTVSLFFRPARQAVLPRIVPEEDLLAANSAMWVGETLSDVINYPIAGLFVVFLKSSLPLAFWFDAVTYLASATLLATIALPPLAKTLGRSGAAGDEEAAAGGSSVRGDLKAGWEFLRHETVLLANTLQGTAGQFSLGVLTVASMILAAELVPVPKEAYRGTYAFMETAIGVGSLIGGFALGAVAHRMPKGKLIIGAYVAFGAMAIALGLVHSVPVVLALLFGMGIANMAFVIPSQTLFQERTPPELMGRVVSFRFALVFGGMSIAMAVGGLAVGMFTAGPVIMVAGMISVIAGVGGLFVRAVRDA
jgi:MFS transporter, DHA3 family, macrolide efflux protein